MPEMQSAEATKPLPIPDETAHHFHVALHDAVRTSNVSMAELRESVNACVCFLRNSDIDPAQMIISMKACAKECNKRYPSSLDEYELPKAEFLMEQIIRWSIIEYYKDV